MSQAITNEATAPPRRVLRSVGAVLTGTVVIVLATTGTDMVFHATSVFPPFGQSMSDGLFWLATAYRVVYDVAGCYITARVAPSRPMLHALAVGVIGVIVTTVGAAVTWNRGPAFGPHWYPLVLIATAMPCAWLGGKLRVAQLSRRPAL